MHRLFQTDWRGRRHGRMGFGMVALLLFVFLSGQTAFAGMKEYHFDIPSQEIITALDIFAETTNYSLLYSSKEIGHVITKKVSGLYTADQALALMLEGTGLVHHKTSDTSVSIKQESSNIPESHLQEAVPENQPVSPVEAEIKQAGSQSKNDSGGDYTLEDTMVTATKTGETRLQETPIAITAISSEELKSKSTFGLTDVSQLAPNTEVLSSAGKKTAYVRGIGTASINSLLESNVPIYLDGIYLERGLGAFNDFVDVERIEVLRGPQGTIFGRNSTGGAINIITKMPTDELSGTAMLEYGSDDKKRFDGTIAGPLLKDKLNGRLTFTASERGSHYNMVSGPDIEDSSLAGVRGVLDFKPSDTVNFTLRGDYTEAEYNDPVFKLLSESGSYISKLGYIEPSGFYDVTNNRENSRDTTNWGVSGHLDIDLPNGMTFRSITAYRKYLEDAEYDNDGTDLQLLSMVDGEKDLDQFSQEIQLDGSWRRLNWLVGAFYYHYEEASATTEPYDLIFPGYYSISDVNQTTDAYALFSNMNFKVTDKFSVGAGIRYSYEEKEVKSNPTESPVPVFGLSSVDLEEAWDKVTPKIGTEYQINPDAMVYASISTGFRSGTFAPSNVLPASQVIDPENNLSYETGIKTDWFDKRLRINAALFLSQYEDMQVSSIVNNKGMLTNAAESTLKGVEIEVLAKPLPALTLNFSGGYLDAKYDDYMGLNSFGQAVDNSGNQMPFVPEISMNMGGQYVFDLKKFGFITVRGDASFRDKTYYSPANEEYLSQDELWLFKAFARYEPSDARWSLELYGKNLTDEEYYTNLSSVLPGDRVADPAPGRTFGVRFTYNF